MILLAQASVRIACPREAAFEYAANLGHFSAWFPNVLRMASANELAFDSVGKRYVETLSVPLGRRRQVALQVVEVTPGSRIVTEGQITGLRPRMEMAFTSLGGTGCEVEWRMFSRSSSRIAHWMLIPVVRHILSKRVPIALRTLRRQLEEQTLDRSSDAARVEMDPDGPRNSMPCP